MTHKSYLSINFPSLLIAVTCTFLLLMTIQRASAEPGVSCTPSDIEKYYRFKGPPNSSATGPSFSNPSGSVRQGWDFLPNPCNFHLYGPEELAREFKGRKFLFVGDSTVRNVAHGMITTMCNSNYMASCAQVFAWPFQWKHLSHAGSCRNTSADNDCRNVRISVRKIENLTSEKHYETKQERKVMWHKGIIPPLVEAEYKGVSFAVLEAGCARHSDGLWKVIDFLLDHPEEVSFDMLVISGGLHCNYRQYWSGNWYLSLAKRWEVISRRVPVIWIEITNCLKDDSGHYFKYGRGWKINYRKLVSCAYAAKHIEAINKVFKRSGAFISPTRFVSKNISMATQPLQNLTKNEAVHPCIFADYLHPTVLCYMSMIQVHFQVFAMAFRNHTARVLSSSSSPLSLVPRVAMNFETGKVFDEGGEELWKGEESWFSEEVMWGVIVGVVLLVVAGVWCRRRRKGGKS